MTECQNCGEVNVVVVNTYQTMGDVVVDEMECRDCGQYSQTARIDPDYDSTPDEAKQ